jgi:4-diphosphocytidyl-2-C-methyl-D-erythritol kinase
VEAQPVNSLQLLAPAKLNLFLHITGRRADGYHELQTVFQLLDYGDAMELFATDTGDIHVHCPGLAIPQEENLAWRAAKLLQSHSGTDRGARIHIDKRLPAGGGLGGGSSNAATTLLALNRLWELELETGELAALGLQLGADVPVFVHGHSAWAEGVGEKLQPLDIPSCHYLVIAPTCQVSTAEVFSHRQLTRNTSPIKMAAVFEQAGRNDCELVVRQLYPEIDKALNWLEKFGQAQLTGTGACVFARFKSKEQAQVVLHQLPGNWQGFVASGINKSPVHTALA